MVEESVGRMEAKPESAIIPSEAEPAATHNQWIASEKPSDSVLSRRTNEG